MSPRVAAVLATLVLALTGCSSTGGSVERRQPDRLPAVTLAALQGKGSIDLGALRGPAVVNLWASWCAPCREELPEYQSFSQKYAGKVDVVGIDFQETRHDGALELARSTGVTYPLYDDPDGRLRALGLPKLILVDAQGRITHQEYVKITSLGQLERLVEKHLPGATA